MGRVMGRGRLGDVVDWRTVKVGVRDGVGDVVDWRRGNGDECGDGASVS